MPRFHFNVHDGKSRTDTEGTDLPDWQTARIEAVRLAGEILREDAPRIVPGVDWRIEVTDHTGLVLFHMIFELIASPVIGRIS